MKRPTKAIIAAAGFGTRFLPQTKAMPKEMMPIIDKPIIQYVVEELVAAGIKNIIIVGSSNKRSIEDHFDLPNEDLLQNLRTGAKKSVPCSKVLRALLIWQTSSISAKKVRMATQLPSSVQHILSVTNHSFTHMLTIFSSVRLSYRADD